MIDDEITYLKKIRRHLHRYPEISGREEKTASYVISELEKTEPDKILTGLGGSGVAAVYGAEGDPDIMLRCELDAIQVPETSSLDYRSVNRGTSHACGHDGHMAIMIGVARHLSKNRPETGRVTLLFQPSEETGEGAERVISDPQFKKIRPRRSYAIHNLPGYETGTVFIKEGPFAAASVGLKCEITGASSHAAFPHQGNSPAGVLPGLIEYLKAAGVPDTADPDYSIGTITYIELGKKAFGISPGSAEIGITLRAVSDALLEEMKGRVFKEAVRLCDSLSLKLSIEEVEPFAATMNSQRCTRIVERAIEAGNLQKVELDRPFPWSEDFGHFSGLSETALVGIGAGEDSPHLHSGNFDFNDDILQPAIQLFVHIIKEEWKTYQN